MKNLFYISIFLLSIQISQSQNQYKKWCYSLNSGLDFMTNPPSVFTSSINTNGGSSICDINGNLLFYSNGLTIWNQSHQVMANGSGLTGNGGAQSCLIVKQPNSNGIYYVFTCSSNGSSISANGGGIRYSIVDMSLASGMGSVTVKNAPLWLIQYTGNMLCGTMHCNGNDVWIVCHEGQGAKEYHSYLLSSIGINTTAVVSIEGTAQLGPGYIKISPNGKKIVHTSKTGAFDGALSVHDFDNSTGTVSSNSVSLTSMGLNPNLLEFSSDGTKLYCLRNNNSNIYQWDLCLPYSMLENSMNIPAAVQNPFGMQLAPDGKIYMGSVGQNSFSVINSPNNYGGVCSFSQSAQYGGISNSGYGAMLNYITTSYRKLSPFSSTVTCQSVKFNAPASTQSVCAISGNTLLSSRWDFGDPASAATNTSNVLNPTHQYSGVGTYTAQFIANYQCTSDTLRQVINIVDAVPSYTISGTTTLCPKQSTTLTANGAYTYSWSNGITTNTVVLSPTVNTQYTVTATNTVNTCSTSKIFTITAAKCTSLFEDENGGNAFMVYPNPNNGNFTIETVLPHAQLNVFNHLGQLVHQTAVVAGKQTLNLQHLPQGIYFAELQNGKQKHVFKLVKEE